MLLIWKSKIEDFLEIDILKYLDLVILLKTVWKLHVQQNIFYIYELYLPYIYVCIYTCNSQMILISTGLLNMVNIKTTIMAQV